MAVIGLICLTVSLGWAQARSTGGAIEGTVKDPSGAVIAGATLTAKSTLTGFSRSATTAEDGSYRLLALDVGTYEVSVEASGFAPQTLKTELQVGQTATLNFTLSVTAGGEVIQVTNDSAPIVEAARTHQAANVSERAVRDLPVNGRNFLEFVRLTPGVNTDPRSGDISFGGLRGTLNSLLIDGSDNNNTFFGQTIGRTGSGRAPYQFSQGSVREFQVNTNAFSAEFGRAGGAVINVVTKSGANDFHGEAFFYYRDKALNAADAIQKANKRAKPANHILQFGGTFSGPIVKNKAFFFFNYDGQRRNEPQPVNFGAPVPNDPVSLGVAAQLSKFLASYDNRFNQDVYIGKVDWQINQSNRYSVRYNYQNFRGVNLENGGANSAQEHTGNSNVKTHTLTNSLTSILRTNLINEFRFQFSRDQEPGTANSTNPEGNLRLGGTTILQIGRNSFSPRETTEKRSQIIDTMSYVHGSHSIKFGVDVNVNKIFNFFPGNFSGVYNFTSYADFADGKPTGGYVQAFPGPGTNGAKSFPNSNEVSVFIQDDWNIASNFKLYYGMRYDVQLKARPPVPNNDSQLVDADIRTDRLIQDTNNFAPRVGFAWQPFHESKTVIRGGYGIFYGRTPSIVTGTAHTQNGITVQAFNFTGAAVPTYPQVFSAPPTGAARAPLQLFFFNKNYVDPIIHQASFGIERELLRDLSLSVSYLFVRGYHQTRSRDINLASPVSTRVEIRSSTATDAAGNPLGALIGTTSALRFGLRPLSRFNRLTQFESTGDSVYHGLAVQLTKRFSHNFQGLISYTWSHGIDNKPDQTSVVVGADDAKNIENSLNIAADRADGESDTRHRFVASYLWDLAYAKNLSNPVAKAILDGWSVSGIITATSGRPFTARAGGDLNNDGNAQTDRAPGFSRNTFRTDNFLVFDFRVQREIRIFEQVRLQFLAEGFNIFNRFNASGVDVNRFSFANIKGIPTLAPNSRFGAPINNSLGPRNFQLAAKLVF